MEFMKTQSQALFLFYMFSPSQWLMPSSLQDRLFSLNPRIVELRTSTYVTESTWSLIMSKMEHVPPLNIFGVLNFSAEHFHPSALGSGQSWLDPDSSLLTLASTLYIFRKFHLKKYFIFLFLERQEGREKEMEKNINVWLPLACPMLGTWTATQACALLTEKLVTLWFAGWCSIHWATPARVGVPLFYFHLPPFYGCPGTSYYYLSHGPLQ